MFQCGKAKGIEEMKKVKGWPTVETKNNPRDDREEDTEEMIEWRSMSQDEMDECWKKLAQKIEDEVLDMRCLQRKRLLSKMEASTKKQEVQNRNVERRVLGNIFASFKEHTLQRLISMHEDSTEGEEMKRQQRMKIMKDMTKKIRSKERMLTTDGGWLIGRRRTARKLGSMQDGKTRRKIGSCIITTEN